MAIMRSPNDMMAAGKQIMLNGREPDGYEDAVKLMNFIAFNTDSGLEEAVCRLLKVLYPDVFDYISESEVIYIATATFLDRRVHESNNKQKPTTEG